MSELVFVDKEPGILLRLLLFVAEMSLWLSEDVGECCGGFGASVVVAYGSGGFALRVVFLVDGVMVRDVHVSST